MSKRSLLDWRAKRRQIRRETEGHTMDAAQFVDTGVADAMAAKVGPNVSAAESPPGKHLAEMSAETLQAVLMAVAGTSRQLQQIAWTRHMRPDAHTDLVLTIGRLMTAENQLRRYLASLPQTSAEAEPAA
jgi:hypothetical protein